MVQNIAAGGIGVRVHEPYKIDTVRGVCVRGESELGGAPGVIAAEGDLRGEMLKEPQIFLGAGKVALLPNLFPGARSLGLSLLNGMSSTLRARPTVNSPGRLLGSRLGASPGEGEGWHCPGCPDVGPKKKETIRKRRALVSQGGRWNEVAALQQQVLFGSRKVGDRGKKNLSRVG